MIRIITSLLVLGLTGMFIYLLINFFNKMGKKLEEKTARQFHILGQLNDLTLTIVERPFKYTKWNPPELKGQLNGYHCHIFTEEHPDGDSTNYFTRIVFDFDNTSDLFFELYRKNIGTAILFGETDIDFDDKEFEKRFSIRTTNKTLTKLVFDQEIRNLLVSNRKKFLMISKIIMKRNQVTLTLHSKMHNDNLRKQVEAMLYIIPQIIKKI